MKSTLAKLLHRSRSSQRDEHSERNPSANTYTSGKSIGTPIVDHSADSDDVQARLVTIQEHSGIDQKPQEIRGRSYDTRWSIVFADACGGFLATYRFSKSAPRGEWGIERSTTKLTGDNVKTRATFAIIYPPAGLPVPSFEIWPSVYGNERLANDVNTRQMGSQDSTGFMDSWIVSFMDLLANDNVITQSTWAEQKILLDIPRCVLEEENEVQYWRYQS